MGVLDKFLDAIKLNDDYDDDGFLDDDLLDEEDDEDFLDEDFDEKPKKKFFDKFSKKKEADEDDAFDEIEEKSGSLFLNNNITNHTSLYSKIKKCSEIVTMCERLGKFDCFWLYFKAVNRIFPCKSKSIRMKCHHLTLRIFIAPESFHNNLGKLTFQATDHILLI